MWACIAVCVYCFQPICEELFDNRVTRSIGTCFLGLKLSLICIDCGAESLWSTLRRSSAVHYCTSFWMHLTLQIADKEIAREEEVGEMLDFMVQQLDRLSIMESMPEDVDSAMVVNRALDVRSACMVYLALNIRHKATPLGTVGILNQEFDLIHLGKVVKTFVLGDQKISDSTDYLKSWVDKYTTALTDVHAHVGMNLTYPLVKERNEMVRGNLPRSLRLITD